MSDLPLVNTREQILKRLNGAETAGDDPWEEMEGYYSMLTAVFTGKGIINNLNRSVILKAFINKHTGEIRTFLAKVLDVPERDKLA
ncbi:MAG: hypothetical protein ABIJ46_02830 [bacterium]